MSIASSPVEKFLAEFHDARPGLTATAYGTLPVVCRGRTFASSYEVLLDAVPPSGALRVLDLACGDGYLLSLLAARATPGQWLCGLDMSAAELAAARARLGPGIPLHQANAQALPLESASVDCVLCHMALMLMDRVEQVVDEVRRVLRGPGARFAAVVGAPAPASPAFAAYVEAISRRVRRPELAEVRFGDRRLRQRDGIAEVLGRRFDDVEIEDIQLSRRVTPQALWDWFLGMYDLYLLSETDRAIVQHEFLEATSSQCGPDGALDFPQALRLACATAR